MYRRHLRDEYRLCMEDLDTAGHIRRRAAEREILSDPHHTFHRVPGFYGGRAVTLQETGGLITVYHMLDADTVSLDFVFDTDPLPAWLVQPTGTWFEDLDLSD